MIIFNKNKHFSKLIEELFNMSMKNIRELNVILTPYGAKPFIEKNKEKFVMISFLYLLFFQECSLQKKYYPKYKEEISTVLDSLIYHISERFNYNPQKISEIYFDIRKHLDNMSNDKMIAEIGLYYGVAVHYLQHVFSDEYNVEDVCEDDTPYVIVGTFFQRFTNDCINVLK